MKLSLSFLLFFAVFHFGTSNVISKSGTQEQLLSDSTAVQNRSDIIMAKPGPLDVILYGNELIFKVCSLEWNGDFVVCYAPRPSNQNVLEDSCDTKCGFYITTLNDMEPISSETIGVGKSDQCFEVKMNNGATSVLSSDGEIAKTTYAPKVVNGIVKLNIINATSECSVNGKNAIIKLETTTAPPTTATTIGQRNQTSSGENRHVSATTDESGSFFADYWWIFLILGIILIVIGIGVGVCCYLRRKKNAKKPISTRRRKLQGSQSPVIFFLFIFFI